MRPRADTLLVWTGAACSYGCGACPIDPNTAPAGVNLADLQAALARLPGREGRLVVLLGGEPFLRPDFLRLIAAIRAAGCFPGIITTGRPLIYSQVREKLRRAALAYLRVQLFGIDQEHDRSTSVPGAFDQALEGLRAWVGDCDPECDVDVALTIRHRGVDSLVSEIERIAQEIDSNDLQIVVAVDPATQTELQDSESLRRTVDALADWNRVATRPLLLWEGLPPSASSSACPSIPVPRPRFVVTRPPACCLGAVGELTRVSAARDQVTRANSFNFVSTGTAVTWTATPDTCTAYQAAGEVDPSRHVWLVDGDRLVLYATDTGDFDGTEIARVKDGWSHLFLDRSPAGVLDDFTEGMRRVIPDAACDPCPNRARCGRRFRLVEGPPFAREEAWIASYIAGLRGCVLDVGCGEQLYRNELAPLLRAGTVQYTGLDPDQLSLSRARAALPEGRFHLGSVEDFRRAPESYDHILCLRSLNHVVDVDEALARMAALLKPGGELLIVECTPFAMLRQPEQVLAADSAPRAGHQHFRNVASNEVLPFARRRSLQVVEHSPASLATTNQWILLLRRPAKTTANSTQMNTDQGSSDGA